MRSFESETPGSIGGSGGGASAAALCVLSAVRPSRHWARAAPSAAALPGELEAPGELGAWPVAELPTAVAVADGADGDVPAAESLSCSLSSSSSSSTTTMRRPRLDPPVASTPAAPPSTASSVPLLSETTFTTLFSAGPSATSIPAISLVLVATAPLVTTASFVAAARVCCLARSAYRFTFSSVARRRRAVSSARARSSSTVGGALTRGFALGTTLLSESAASDASLVGKVSVSFLGSARDTV
mmetsp:Transcript_57867/g.114871  ORF Transcript_57867/g.114871 Transcript_57867/m.114871 type:complete len:243 (-) Transcript_57867:354-1082(-)